MNHIKNDYYVLGSEKEFPDSFCNKGKDCEICHEKVKHPYLSIDILIEFTKIIKESLNMNLFGYDMMYLKENNCYYVFDINPFPSFTEYDNFNESFGTFLKEMIKKYKDNK